MRVTYAPDRKEVYGDEEIEAVVKSLKDGWLAPGKLVKEFEEKVAKRFGKKYGVMVNSGSSANLLASEEINKAPTITPALTFTTTLSYLAHPILEDVKEGTYQIDFSGLTKFYGNAFIPNLLGNIPEIKRDLIDGIIVEDSCDTITDALKDVSDITTTSFYASHIITCAGGGGMVMCNDEEMYQRFLSKRAWGRSVVAEDDLKSRFDGDIDKKFLFEHRGHNLQPIELQAGFGLVQLSKLDDTLKKKRQVFKKIYSFFKKYEDRFILPVANGEADWLNFPLTIREGINRKQFCIYLEENDIQTRPIFSGNITKQPAYQPLWRDFPVADKITKDGLLIGAHQGMTDDKLDYLFSKVEAYLG